MIAAHLPTAARPSTLASTTRSLLSDTRNFEKKGAGNH